MKYYNQIKQNSEQFLNDLKGLIEIPSLYDEQSVDHLKPFGQECRNALDYMLDLAKRDGFEVDDVDGYAGVISLGEGNETFAMLGHLDVVPVDHNEWLTDPFKLVIKEDIAYGRGVLDDKGPTMAAYYALKMIKDSGLKLNKKIQLILGCDEESGMQCMAYYKQHRQSPTMGMVPDADFPVIYGEKGIINLDLTCKEETVITKMVAGSRPNVVIGHCEVSVASDPKPELFKSFLRANHLEGSVDTQGEVTTYRIKGVSFHGSMPHKGLNAALYCLKFIDLAYDDKLSNQLVALLENPFGKGLHIECDGAYMGPLTLNLGIITIKNHEMTCTLDIRYPNDLDADQIYQSIEQSVIDSELEVVIENFSNSNPLFVDPQSELVKTCMSVYQEVTNDTFSPAKTMGGGTYARVFENMFAFGPEFPMRKKEATVGGPHEKNEGFYLEDFYQASAIYAEVLERMTTDENSK